MKNSEILHNSSLNKVLLFPGLFFLSFKLVWLYQIQLQGKNFNIFLMIKITYLEDCAEFYVWIAS